MQWSLRLNHGRLSPSTSIRRKPVRSMSRIAASPVGCSPSAAASRITRPRRRISSSLNLRFRLPTASCRTPSAGFLPMMPRRVAWPSNARKCTDRSAGDAGASSRPAPATFLTSASRLARRDIRLHSLDVIQSETAYEPHAKQGLDVSLDPASITFECRCLDRPAVSAEEPAGFSLLEIPIAHFLDGHADPDALAVGRRVGAFRYSSELLAGEVARDSRASARRIALAPTGGSGLPCFGTE